MVPLSSMNVVGYFQAKLLEEMDEEFGVGELVDNVMRKKPKVCVHFMLCYIIYIDLWDYKLAFCLF